MMNLRYLRNFLVLAETLHFGEAAKRLHMTQPPLSRQLASLEQELGIELFSRHSRSVALTPAGEDFYQNIRRLLDDYDFAVRSARGTARGERGELRIGFTMCAAWSILPRLLAAFARTHPDVTVKLDETLPRDLQGALQRGDVDIGLSFPMAVSAPLHYRPIYQEPLCAVVPGSHPLAHTSPLTVAALAAEPFITFPASTAPELHEAVMACCRQHGFEPQVRMETHLQQTIVNLVASGLGVSLVPDSMRRMQLPGATFLALADSPLVEQGIFWNDRNPNPCLAVFLDSAEGWQRDQLTAAITE